RRHVLRSQHEINAVRILRQLSTGNGGTDDAENRRVGQPRAARVVVGRAAGGMYRIGDWRAGAVGIGGVDVEVRRATDAVSQVGQNRHGRVAAPIAVPDIVNVLGGEHHRAAVVLDAVLWHGQRRELL